MLTKNMVKIFCIAIVGWCVSTFGGETNRPNYKPITFEKSAPLQKIVDNAIQAALVHYHDKNLESNQLAMTLVKLDGGTNCHSASYRGDVQIYPASVIKLFYLAAAHQWLEEGKIADNAELQRALKDMIVDSNNEATHYIVDVLTGTTSGPELSDTDLEQWQQKRDAVNRFFTSLGYSGINVNKKPWNDGPYGREVQAIKKYNPNRNLLTTDATARLFAEIATGRIVTTNRCNAMMGLLQRDQKAAGKDPDHEALFISNQLPEGVKLWSKAGWTSKTRHVAACIEFPGGSRWIIAIFTQDQAQIREIIHFIAAQVIREIGAKPPAGK
jgi:beta-lactamase class A